MKYDEIAGFTEETREMGPVHFLLFIFGPFHHFSMQISGA